MWIKPMWYIFPLHKHTSTAQSKIVRWLAPSVLQGVLRSSLPRWLSSSWGGPAAPYSVAAGGECTRRFTDK